MWGNLELCHFFTVIYSQTDIARFALIVLGFSLFFYYLYNKLQSNKVIMLLFFKLNHSYMFVYAFLSCT